MRHGPCSAVQTRLGSCEPEYPLLSTSPCAVEALVLQLRISAPVFLDSGDPNSDPHVSFCRRDSVTGLSPYPYPQTHTTLNICPAALHPENTTTCPGPWDVPGIGLCPCPGQNRLRHPWQAQSLCQRSSAPWLVICLCV